VERKLSVYVLSSNRLLRESIERLIRKRCDLDLRGAQSIQPDSTEEIINSGAEVMVADSLQFILDPGGWRAASQADRRKILVVMVAMDDDKDKFLTAVKHGVVGYVLQEAPNFTRALFDSFASPSSDLPNTRTRDQWGLTRREQQLVPLIGRGMTNKEIAAQLSLSEETIKSHVHRILRKVGVDDRLGVFEACQF